MPNRVGLVVLSGSAECDDPAEKKGGNSTKSVRLISRNKANFHFCVCTSEEKRYSVGHGTKAKWRMAIGYTPATHCLTVKGELV